MVDPGIVAQVAMIAAAAVVGGAVGGMRGMSGLRKRAHDEVESAMNAQRLRIELLEKENAELRAKILVLEGQVRQLREELDIEKRITARFGKDA